MEEGSGVMTRRGELAVAEIRGMPEAEDALTMGEEGEEGECGGMSASESCGVGVEGGCGNELRGPMTATSVPERSRTGLHITL